jgi:hypothetical protein
MRSLALQVDRILNRFLASLPPGDLNFDYSHLPGLITYTLRIKQVKVGTIEIENGSQRSLGVLIRFSVIKNNFSVIQDGEEFILEITNLNDIIMENIKAYTGKKRWREIASEPDGADVSTALPNQSSLLDQKIYADTIYFYYLHRHPWENIPNNLWDRHAVKLWCEGYSNQDIARWVNVHPRTVTNRISELRRRYPRAGIPTHKQRLKRMISEKTRDIE